MRRDWSDVKGKTGDEMRQLKGSSGTNKLKSGSGGKITAEEMLKGKRREQQEAIRCLSEKCL